MIRISISFLILVGLYLSAIGQQSLINFPLEISGLKEEYSEKFKKEKDIISKGFDEYDLIGKISILNVHVNYKEGSGFILIELNYNHEKVFSQNSKYYNLNKNLSQYGKGISVFLQHQLFLILSSYKYEVAREEFRFDTDLLDFESVIKLIKPNGDWVIFSGYNTMTSQGYYRFRMFNSAYLQVDDKQYEIRTSNTRMLQEMKFFQVGKTEDLSGNRTDEYYFCEFFEIGIENDIQKSEPRGDVIQQAEISDEEQLNNEIGSLINEDLPEKEIAEEVFTIVEDQPSPIGGMAAFYEYIGSNLKYPAEARKKDIEGIAYIEFIVDFDGSITGVKPVEGMEKIGYGCEDEAIRVIKSSPKWKPGRNDGQPVKVRMIMPLTFKLGSND